MTPPPVVIAGWSSAAKVPGVTAEVVYGAGPISASAIPLVCLLVGLQLSTGLATGNRDINQLTNADDAAALYGSASELANMAYKALAIPGINLYGMGVIESSSGSPASATLTITFTMSTGTNPVAQGTITYWIGGRVFQIYFGTTDTVTTLAISLKNAINSNPKLPFTAGNSSGVLTVTIANKGVRGNEYIGFQDVTKANGSNVVSTITGGSSVTGGGTKFTGGADGSTPEAIATVLNVLYPGTWDFVAVAQNDVTNAALFLTHSQQKAGPLEMRPTRFVFGFTGSLVNATTLAQTTLNDQRSRVHWALNCESPSWEIAAVAAAVETQGRQADPGCMFDSAAGLGLLPGIVAQRAQADWAQRSTQESALSNGITPLITVGSTVQIVRLIGTHSLSGTTPDYRTLDGADDYVPDFMRKDLTLLWQFEFVVANPRVADDPDPTQRDRPAGVATPTLWNNTVMGRMLQYEKQGPNGPLPILVNTVLHPPTSGYDRTAKRIVTLIPCEVLPSNHQVGLSIRQIVPS